MERKLTSLERSENKESLRVSYSRRMSLPPQSLEHPWEMRGKRVKALVFPVVIYGCERWTIKKAEHWRIDAFELWCWRRLLRVPWTARRSNQSILKEISPAYSLESLTLKLKPQSFGHLMWRTDSLEKPLMLERFEDRRRGWQRRKWLDGIIDSMNMSLSKLWLIMKNREVWHAAVPRIASVRHNWQAE